MPILPLFNEPLNFFEADIPWNQEPLLLGLMRYKAVVMAFLNMNWFLE